MKRNVELSEADIAGIRRQAHDVRTRFGVDDYVPIANDIRTLLERRGIIICEYPFKKNGKSHLDAEIARFVTSGEDLRFIGLNTSLYYDEQIFALGHELYHIITRTGQAYDKKNEDVVLERKADRFSAEFLFPGQALEDIVIREFGKKKIAGVSRQRLLRFIASLQIEWWLPYRSIILRLNEESYITDAMLDSLEKINDRDPASEYSIITRTLDNSVYSMLNTQTRTTGISNGVLDIIVRNYEDGIITYDEFNEALSIYDKRPEDFGYTYDDEPLDDEDLDMFREEKNS